MFWRKVDPNERREVVNLLGQLSLASKEIDTAVDRMKMQFIGLGVEVTPQVFMATVTDARQTVESVRADTTKPGFWPRLRDETGAKRSAETRLLREELFKHQLWRLKLYGDMVASFTEGREDETLARESNQATKAYETMVMQMSSAMIKLGKHYKISVWEYIQ